MSKTLAVACLFAAVVVPAPAAWAPAPASPTRDATRLALAEAAWTLDGMPVPPPSVSGAAVDVLVALPMRARGERWGMQFETDAAGTAGLVLDHRGGPDGLLYEAVLDGQRLTPARDAWRPSSRDLRTDLGPLWLGPGTHLLEFVAREQPAGAAALHLRALELTWR